MSKPKAFEYEAVVSNEQIIEYLEKILSGFKAGQISFSQDSNAVKLEARAQAKFSVEVKETPKAKSLKLKIKWRDAESTTSDESPPLKLNIN